MCLWLNYLAVVDGFQLRRVTFYTRNDPEPQELSDSESDDEYSPDGQTDEIENPHGEPGENH